MSTADTVEVNSLDRFVHFLSHWHANKVATLEHMKQIPEGSEIEIQGQESKVVQGDFLAGYKTGIQLALMELGELPFTAEVETTG